MFYSRAFCLFGQAISLLLLSLPVFGQGPGLAPALTIIPPSPEAANLGRYAANPISYYTGTPSITIPLHELSDGPLKLPLTLSYNAAGNRVEDMASWVGLGWALNSGGVVTRSTQGAADDQQPSGFNRAFINYFDLTQTYTYSDLVWANKNAQNVDGRSQMLARIAQGCADVQPDIFYFNFNGYTGQFFFDYNRQLHVSCAQDVRVVPTFVNGVITSWRITTDEGTVYVFAAAEYTTQKPKTHNISGCIPVAGQRFISSWYLSSVTDVNQEHRLAFYYDSYELYHALQMSESIENGIGNCADVTDVGVFHGSGSFISVNGLRPRRIVASDSSSIEFVAATTLRTDTAGLNNRYSRNLRALDHVVLRDAAGSEKSTVYLAYDAAYSTGRLTLQQVQRGRLNGERLPGYALTYNTRIPLPTNVQSRAQDHWGFYNGAERNDWLYHSLVPGCQLPRLISKQVLIRPGARRDVSPDSVQAGILTKMQYPTGGFSVFTYEPNEYSYVNNHRLDSLQQYTRRRVSRRVVAAGGNVGQGQCDRPSIALTMPAPHPRLPYDFGSGLVQSPDTVASTALYLTLGSGILDSVKVHLVSTVGSGGNTLIGRKPYAEMLDASGKRIIWTGTADNTNPLRSSDGYCWLGPGSYSLNAYACNGGSGNDGYDYAQMSVEYEVDSLLIAKKTGGGLRIKRIRDYSSASDSLYTEKTFSYNERSGDPNRMGTLSSSGCIYGEPKYEYVTSYNWLQSNPVPDHSAVPVVCDYWLRLARNRTSLGSSQGSLVGYREVAVTDWANHQPYSQTIYRFTSPVEYPDSVVDLLPFPPAGSLGYRTGQLLSQTDYRGTASGWVPVKKTENTYQFYSVQVPGLAVANPNALPAGTVGTGYVGMFVCRYRLNAGHARPSQTRETLFHPDGQNSHATTTTYAYNAPGTRLQQQRLQIGLDAERITAYSYPDDFAQLPGSLYTRMNNELHFLPPIETVTLVRKGPALGVVAARFEGFGLQGTKLQLRSEQMLKTSAPIAAGSYQYATASNSGTPDTRLMTQVVIDAYDGRGNITQLHRVNDVPVARLWGYGGSYLLAEAHNATYADLVRILGQTTINRLASASPGTDADVRAALQPLRAQLPQARVTTYTHAPLMGETSQTDPSGRTTTYEYDGLGRLLRTRDEQDRILSQQQYHYAR